MLSDAKCGKCVALKLDQKITENYKGRKHKKHNSGKYKMYKGMMVTQLNVQA